MKNKYSVLLNNLIFISKGKALDKSKLVYVQRPMHKNGKLSYTHKWVKPDAVQDTDIIKENHALLPKKHKALKNKPPKEVEKPVKKPKPPKAEKPPKEEKPVKKPKPPKDEKPPKEENFTEQQGEGFRSLELNKNDYIQKMFPKQEYHNDPNFLQDEQKYINILDSVLGQSGINFQSSWRYDTFNFEHSQKPIIGGVNFGDKKIRIGIIPQGVSKLKSGKSHRNYFYFSYDRDTPEKMHRYQHLHELIEGIYGKTLGSAILENAHKNNPKLSKDLSSFYRDTREHYEQNGRKDNSDQFGFDYSEQDGETKLPKNSKNPVFSSVVKNSVSFSKDNKVSHNKDPHKVLFKVGNKPEDIGYARANGGRLGYSDTEHGTDLWWVYDHNDKVSKMREKFGEPLGILKDNLQLHKIHSKTDKEAQREKTQESKENKPQKVETRDTEKINPSLSQAKPKPATVPVEKPLKIDEMPSSNTKGTLLHKEYLKDGHELTPQAIKRLGFEQDAGGVYIPQGYVISKIPKSIEKWRNV